MRKDGGLPLKGKDGTGSMIIPSRYECLALMEQVRMHPHIQKHCFMVAEVALYLARFLNQTGTSLDLRLIESGALLHDIAKPRSLTTGEKHDEIGAKMLEDWGYSSLSSIVREHAGMDPDRARGPITESVLVNYADKRVRHYEIVTLEDRFLDLIERYARKEEHRTYLMEKLGLYKILERRIFSRIPFRPDETELMQLPLPLRHEAGG